MKERFWFHADGDDIVLGVDTCTAFDANTIGSKVESGFKGSFKSLLAQAVAKHDTKWDREPGQHFIVMPDEAHHMVSAGDGKATDSVNHYHLRSYRGRVEPYLHREMAGTTTFCACIVYTREAYLRDPDVVREGRGSKLSDDCTHVIVAVIASSTPEAPLTPWRFVANLGGGNREAERWSADEIRAKAAVVADYWSRYAVVADEV